VLAVGASAVIQILTDPRITSRFIGKSLLVLAVYAVHCAAGFLVIWLLLPKGPAAALGATAAFLGWVGFGFLGLIRFAPRLREPPAWLVRVGIADLVCLGLIVGGVVSARGWI
jgi:hypothetical protein